MKKMYLLLLLLLGLGFNSHISAKEAPNPFSERSAAYLEVVASTEVSVDKTMTAVAIPAAIVKAIKKAVKVVLRALDLVMQRLQDVQLKVQLGLEKLKNVMSELRLDEISAFAAEKKEIFDKYYQELWTVKDKLDQINAVKEAILSQADLLDNYTEVFAKFSADSYLSPEELGIVYNTYQGMLLKNVNIISDLSLLVQDFEFKMQDGDRLGLIKNKLDEINQVSADFNAFTKEVVKLSFSRSKGNIEIDEMKLYYGLD